MDKQKLLEAERIGELFFRRLTGSLTADEEAELEAWTARNGRRRQLAQMLADADNLQQEQNLLQTVDTRQPLLAMQRRIAGKSRRFRPYVWRIAATVAVLLTGGLLWYWHSFRVVPPVMTDQVHAVIQQASRSCRLEGHIEPATSGTPVAEYRRTLTEQYNVSDDAAVEGLLKASRITTKFDKEYWLTLPDGSLVHLNHHTRLIYPERFTGDTRNVVLSGEAYFMVAKDRRHPFVVHTEHGGVRVLGTEFNVNTHEGQLTEVVLVEGTVDVMPVGAAHQRLQPGQKCVVSDGLCSTEDVDVSPYVAWNEGMFSFQSWPLDRVLGVLTRWYGFGGAEFQPDSLRQKCLDGSFSRYDDAANILESIAKVLGVAISIVDNTIMIQDPSQ